MSEAAIDLVAQAVYETLWATTRFKSGSAHVRIDVGSMPSFMVWWPGWESHEEAAPVKQPHMVTHQFQLDVFAPINSGDIPGSESRFRLLIQDTILALRANPRLNNACLRFRVKRGTNEIGGENNNPFFVSSITIDVDRPTW